MEAFKAWAGKNRVVLGAGGAALVVGVAVLRSRGSGSGSGATGGTTTGPSSGSQLANVNGAAYDSTSSDVYNALQPQIEATRDLLLKLQSDGMVNVIPTPALPKGPTEGETGVTTETPAPTLDRISTNWNSSSGSIYNGSLSDGRSVAINQNDVWSGTFGGSGAAGGYNASEADQIREQLRGKGLLSTSADAAREAAMRLEPMR